MKIKHFVLTPELVDVKSSQFVSQFEITVIITFLYIAAVFTEVDNISSCGNCYFETGFPSYMLLFSEMLTSACVSHALIVNLLKGQPAC